ncbi:MAG: PD-(D/E)XK nuclease family protein [Vicingaceae bacterium]
MKFLEHLAEHILAKGTEKIKDVTVVLPNVRAKLFLSRFLAIKAKKSMWMPRMLSSREFMEELAGIRTAEDYVLLGQLHQALPEGMEEKTDVSKFLNWAGILLQDLKEIDHELADAGALFNDLYNARELEAWSPESKDLNESSLHYLEVCRSLPVIYDRFNEYQLANGTGHSGFIQRKASERVETNEFGDQLFVFAGFNALTAAEKKIFSFMNQTWGAELFFDYDRYYVDDEIHEAGHFARINSFHFKQNPLNWTADNFKDISKEVIVYKCAHSIEQTYALREVLEQLTGEVNENTTAIVLPEEAMLIPVLKQLPVSIKHINVTMGYNLKNSPFYGLLDGIIRMYFNVISKRATSFYHSDVRRLLRNEAWRDTFDQQGQLLKETLIQQIDKSNMLFISAGKLNEVFQHFKAEGRPSFAMLRSSGEVLNLMDDLLLFFDSHYKKETTVYAKIQREFIYHHFEVNRLVKEVSANLGTEVDIAQAHKLWRNYTQITKVQFTGEPLEGLQIMGLLETRNLDFEHVYLLNMNEGSLPSRRRYHSVLPFDLKRQYGLLVHREREAVFAYHFYRLLQRSQFVHLFYENQGDAMSNGEMSRFIRQLKRELVSYSTNNSFREKNVKIAIKEHSESQKQVFRNDKLTARLTTLLERGISPTALTTYLNCPLDFYYRYVIGLKDADEVNETIEAGIFGEVLHNSLEKIYTPYIGKRLVVGDIASISEKAAKAIESAFLKHIDANQLGKGKNLLSVNIAHKSLKHFLKEEEIRHRNSEVTLLGLEKELSAELILPFGKVKVRGKIDRIESINGKTNIIDYKTGAIQPNELKVKNINEVFSGKKNKYLQLLTYSWLAYKSSEFGATFSPAVCALRGGESLHFLQLGEESTFGPEELEAFEAGLIAMLTQLVESNESLVHNASSLYCNYC